jgi:hypothetical protein
VPGCFRGDLRLVGVAFEVGGVTRTTLSGREEGTGGEVAGGVYVGMDVALQGKRENKHDKKHIKHRYMDEVIYSLTLIKIYTN